jgi:DNA-binding transcriptional LysR family regulator
MRAAGLKMNVAVSSISRQIAQLEAALGIRLLETGRRSIKLTDAGQLAFDHYQAQVASREAFSARLEALRGLRAGVVELAIGDGCQTRALHVALDRFQSQHPGIELAVTSAASDDIVQMILDDEVHVAIGLAIPTDPKLRVRTSARQPLTVVMHPDHPLARSNGVGLSDLAAHDLCLAPRGSRIRQILAQAELRQQVWLRAAMTANGFQTMREMALLGRAATVLPAAAVSQEIDDGALVSRPLVGMDIEDASLELVMRLGRQLPSAAMLALPMLEQQVKAWSRAAAPEALSRAEG